MNNILKALSLIGFLFAVVALAPNNQEFNGLIISWQEEASSSGILQIRTRETFGWSEWMAVKRDEDHDEHDEITSTSEEIFDTLINTNKSSAFEYRVIGNGITNIHIDPIYNNAPGKRRFFAATNGPRGIPIISRQEWGADETLTFKNGEIDENNGNHNELSDSNERELFGKDDEEIERIEYTDREGRTYRWPLQYAKDIKFIVVHHTASAKDLDKPKNAIQNILYYHAVRRGWGDIGYNYLIDTEGNIYEGRKGGVGVIGGHARPVNKASVGIALLGNFEDGQISPRALDSLLILSRKLAKDHNIKLNKNIRYNGKTYEGLHGHGDNSATACPGYNIKEQLEEIRDTITYQNRSNNPLFTSRYDFRDQNRDRIIVAKAGEEKEFTIKLKNTGASAWDNKTYLMTTNSGEDRSIPRILATLAEERVESGQIGIFKGTIPQNLVSGLRLAKTRLVANGNENEIVAKEISVPIFVEGVHASYEVVRRSDPPKILQPGEKARAWIELKNTSNFTWKRAGKNKVQIGTTQDRDRKSPLFEGDRRIARLRQSSVGPGEIGRFYFYLTAPSTPGRYVEHFAPVIEGVTWMPDAGLHFDVTIEGEEKPIRVLIRDFDSSRVMISSEEKTRLYEGKKRITTIRENAQITIRKTRGKYAVKVRGTVYELQEPPRIISIPAKAGNSGILRVNNYENRPAWNPNLNDNLFEGTLEIRTLKNGKLSVINELPLERYLTGLAEVSNGDHKEKIRTIIILARSYARYHLENNSKFPNEPYDLDNDPNSTQKYLGYGLTKRSPNITQAVQDTRGMIVTYHGDPVLTPYFSQSDGRTRSAEEVWGWKDRPYLQSVNDSHCGATQLLGHGVGLSGCGATALAKQGKSAEDIIKYYYKGVEIEPR
ncbi:hypothetical protein COV82_00895 [Candidatus Peregrinibacteria bacterium CG11_big_fil_rev_8_21_14_0_20_46_8]|nr:MAG: hypothetical protein COV82_00895 [Candidatus Peregrinibacteria bacterium CG11_big_fil_rev_8_21_14_0_20_46_8]